MTLKSDAQMKACTMSIYESGKITLSKIFRESLSDERVSLSLYDDYKYIQLDPMGEEFKIRKDGSIAAKQEIARLDRRKICFPMVYRMEYDREHEDWIGTLQPPDKLSRTSKVAKHKEAGLALEKLV